MGFLRPQIAPLVLNGNNYVVFTQDGTEYGRVLIGGNNNVPVTEIVTLATLPTTPAVGDEGKLHIIEDGDPTSGSYVWNAPLSKFEPTTPLKQTYNDSPPSVTLAMSQKATLDAIAAYTAGLLDDRGNFNPSTGNYPISTSGLGGSGPSGAIMKGDIWYISAAGNIQGTTVTAGAAVRALTDAPGNSNANWDIIDANITTVQWGGDLQLDALGDERVIGIFDKPITGPFSTTANIQALVYNAIGTNSGKWVITNMGTAAFKNVPAVGVDASTTEVVMGDDSRLHGPFTPSTVFGASSASTASSVTVPKLTTDSTGKITGLTTFAITLSTLLPTQTSGNNGYALISGGSAGTQSWAPILGSPYTAVAVVSGTAALGSSSLFNPAWKITHSAGTAFSVTVGTYVDGMCGRLRIYNTHATNTIIVTIPGNFLNGTTTGQNTVSIPPLKGIMCGLDYDGVGGTLLWTYMDIY